MCSTCGRSDQHAKNCQRQHMPKWKIMYNMVTPCTMPYNIKSEIMYHLSCPAVFTAISPQIHKHNQLLLLTAAAMMFQHLRHTYVCSRGHLESWLAGMVPDGHHLVYKRDGTCPWGALWSPWWNHTSTLSPRPFQHVRLMSHPACTDRHTGSASRSCYILWTLRHNSKGKTCAKHT